MYGDHAGYWETVLGKDKQKAGDEMRDELGDIYRGTWIFLSDLHHENDDSGNIWKGRKNLCIIYCTWKVFG